MKMDRERFERWAESVHPEGKLSYNRIAKTAKISSSSLHFQKTRGYVETSVLVAYARNLGLNPIQELLKFDEFSRLGTDGEPGDVEVLSQLGPEWMMEELLARLHHQEIEQNPGPLPEPQGLSRWVESYKLYGRYQELGEVIGVAGQSEFSRKLSDNRITIGQLLALCNHANLNFRFGLAVAGIVTLEEAGYAWDIREKVLTSAPGATVIEALWGARKSLEKSVQAKELERDVYRSFG